MRREAPSVVRLRRYNTRNPFVCIPARYPTQHRTYLVNVLTFSLSHSHSCILFLFFFYFRYSLPRLSIVTYTLLFVLSSDVPVCVSFRSFSLTSPPPTHTRLKPLGTVCIPGRTTNDYCSYYSLPRPRSLFLITTTTTAV